MQIQFYLTHCSTDRIGTAHISIWSHAQKHINNPVANKCSCKYTSKYTNIQIFKYTNIQIHKYTNTQIYKYTNMQIHKYTNIQIYNYKNIHHLPIRKHLHLHLYNNEFKCNHFITKSEKTGTFYELKAADYQNPQMELPPYSVTLAWHWRGHCCNPERVQGPGHGLLETGQGRGLEVTRLPGDRLWNILIFYFEFITTTLGIGTQRNAVAIDFQDHRQYSWHFAFCVEVLYYSTVHLLI